MKSKSEMRGAAKSTAASAGALVPRGSRELEKLPDFVREDATAGLEHLTREDVAFPRMAVAQGLSPQLDRKEASYIEELKLGDAWNTITQQVYGAGPWDVAIVKVDRPRWVEFNPREDGGGVRDLNVPANDPRTRWRELPEGRLPPAATQFYEFVIVFLETQEVIAVSYKSSDLKVARVLNSLLMGFQQVQGRPVYATKFKLSVVGAKNSKGSWNRLRFTPSGLISDEDTLRYLKTCFDGLRDKTLNIDRDPGREPGEDDDRM